MGCQTSNKIFIVVSIILAVVVGVLAVSSLQFPPNYPLNGLQKFLMGVSAFFQTMLPVLGVAALIKFVCCCGSSNHCQK